MRDLRRSIEHVTEQASVRADLRSYYERESKLGLRQVLRSRRLEFRERYLELLSTERRTSVIDFGSGPGHDGAGFVAAGLRFVGVDLAHGNGVLAANENVTVVQGSITEPPIRSRSFEAGWSMSTLMHLMEHEVSSAIAAMAEVLVPGAPMMIGMWGGPRSDDIDDQQIDGERRLFSLRPIELNSRLLEAAGTVESAEVVPGQEGQDYQLFLLRV